MLLLLWSYGLYCLCTNHLGFWAGCRDDVSFTEPQFPSDDEEEEGDQLYGDEFGDEEFCGHQSVDDSAHGRIGALEALLGNKH